MAPRIVITGASGKLGGATLKAILDYNLVPPSDLVIATSSKLDHPLFLQAASQGAQIRWSTYDSVHQMTQAFTGCQRLFLVSSPHIILDFDGCVRGGRESHHFNALKGAAKASGITHVYYTSLAFQDPSKAAVMRAHLATEAYLKEQKDFDYTIIREGIYSESWPLYLGHFEVPSDPRDEIVVGPDGPVSWTSIEDLGLANALILTGDEQAWSGKTLWLSAGKTMTLKEIASVITNVRGKPLAVKESTQQQYIEHYTQHRGRDPSEVEWWSSTYPALKDNECSITESPLEDLLSTRGRKPKPMETILADMLSKIQ